MATYNFPSPVERRPCYVDGKKALFHLWTEKIDFVFTNTVKMIVGIVEFENGRVTAVEPHLIRFVPTSFNEYCFTEDLHSEIKVNLPVNPGDTVWIINPDEKEIYCQEITEIKFSNKSALIVFRSGQCYSIWDNEWKNHIGISIFFSREKAERALKERANNEG